MTKLFDNHQIDSIYRKHVVKDNNYYSRFRDIRNYFSIEELETYRNIDTPRLISLIDFKEWVIKHKLKSGKRLLYTCSNDMELNYISYEISDLIEYPPYDLHDLNLPEKNYNFIVFNQTLEHLYNPFVAIQNLYNHLDNNGAVYTTVPTINIPHMTPIHFWGITPIGLCLLMMSAGFEILECGHWGSQEYIRYIFDNNDWPGYSDISKNFDLTHNSVSQSQTWVLAKKSN